MKFTHLIKFSLSNIWSQKLRTILALLAITVGSLLMFIIPSVMLGTQREMNKLSNQGYSFQTKTLAITQNYNIEYDLNLDRYSDKILDEINTGEYGKNLDKNQSKLLTWQDAINISTLPGSMGISELPVLENYSNDYTVYSEKVGKYIKMFTSNIKPDDNTIFFPDAPSIKAIGSAYPYKDYHLELNSGRLLVPEDQGTNNILLNDNFAKGLRIKDYNSLIGSHLLVSFKSNNTNFLKPEYKTYKLTIVGITKPEANVDPMLMSVISQQMATIMIPYQTALSIDKWQNKNVPDYKFTPSSLTIVYSDNESGKKIIKNIRDLGYDVQGDLVQNEMMINQGNQGTLIATLVGSLIGLIVLLVGALNILSIMMMAVTERTKEIGILMALGASRATIRRLFFAESMTLTFIGALSGVFWGWIVSLIANYFMVPTFNNNPYSTLKITSVFAYPWWLILGVIIFTTLVGLITGIAPAIRASRLKVVDSIRYE